MIYKSIKKIYIYRVIARMMMDDDDDDDDDDYDSIKIKNMMMTMMMTMYEIVVDASLISV